MWAVEASNSQKCWSNTETWMLNNCNRLSLHIMKGKRRFYKWRKHPQQIYTVEFYQHCLRNMLYQVFKINIVEWIQNHIERKAALKLLDTEPEVSAMRCLNSLVQSIQFQNSSSLLSVQNTKFVFYYAIISVFHWTALLCKFWKNVFCEFLLPNGFKDIIYEISFNIH